MGEKIYILVGKEWGGVEVISQQPQLSSKHLETKKIYLVPEAAKISN